MNRTLLIAFAAMFLGGLLLLIPGGDGPTPVDPGEPDVPIVIDDSFKLGRHVLIVYESEEKPAYPSSQSLILDSADFKQFLSQRATDGWRILDKDANTEFMPEVFQQWIKRDRSGIPWILVSNGQTGVEGELPATIDETKTLIGKLLQ